MLHRHSRRAPRHRRPAPPSPTRAQARQQINRISVLYRIEALIELQKPEPDCVHLARLEKDASLLNQILSCIGEAA